MASRKIYVNVTVRLIVDIDEKVSIEDVISDMDYNFSSQTDGAEVAQTDIENWDVVYVK